MLARPHRLTRGSDYRLVVRRGARCGGGRIIVSMLATGEDRPSRFGFIVSKQVGNAVTRNTVRRRLKAVCAALLPEIPAGSDLVLRALPAAAGAGYAELSADAARCIRRLSAPFPPGGSRRSAPAPGER